MLLATSTYDAQGDLVCPRCAAQSMIAASEGKAASSMVAWAFGVLGSSLLSLFTRLFLPPLLVVLVAALVVGSGVGWFRTMGRFPRYRQQLGSKYLACLSLVGLGMAVAVVGQFALMFIR